MAFRLKFSSRALREILRLGGYELRSLVKSTHAPEALTTLPLGDFNARVGSTNVVRRASRGSRLVRDGVAHFRRLHGAGHGFVYACYDFFGRAAGREQRIPAARFETGIGLCDRGQGGRDGAALRAGDKLRGQWCSVLHTNMSGCTPSWLNIFLHCARGF